MQNISSCTPEIKLPVFGGHFGIWGVDLKLCIGGDGVCVGGGGSPPFPASQSILGAATSSLIGRRIWFEGCGYTGSFYYKCLILR